MHAVILAWESSEKLWAALSSGSFGKKYKATEEYHSKP